MFKNLTTRFELDLKLTRAVINEMVARAKVEVLAENAKADAVLAGEILSFTVNPIGFSGEAAADRYNITIVARIVLRDLVNQKVLFSNPSFVYVKQYEVPQGSDFESLETEAIGQGGGRVRPDDRGQHPGRILALVQPGLGRKPPGRIAFPGVFFLRRGNLSRRTVRPRSPGLCSSRPMPGISVPICSTSTRRNGLKSSTRPGPCPSSFLPGGSFVVRIPEKRSGLGQEAARRRPSSSPTRRKSSLRPISRLRLPGP